jgi:hypothetical protein
MNWGLVALGFGVLLFQGLWTALCINFGFTLRRQAMIEQSASEQAKWQVPGG